MSAGDRDTLTALLAEHKDQGYWKQSDVPGLASYVSACSCGSGDGHAYHLTEVVGQFVRAAQAQALREAADLIAVTKFNDPFGVNREAWKLLRDRADRLDPTDQLQNPED